MLAGQVGLGDHAHVAPGVILGGQSGVFNGKTASAEPGTVLYGTPARPLKQVLREQAVLARLAKSRARDKSSNSNYARRSLSAGSKSGHWHPNPCADYSDPHALAARRRTSHPAGHRWLCAVAGRAAILRCCFRPAQPAGRSVRDYNNQITYSPDGFTGRNVTLKRLIAEAWHCQLDQIQGPPWIDRNEYEIAARMPEGVSREQVSLMLRSLLSSRFRLKMHSESRQMRVYELTVSQKGANRSIPSGRAQRQLQVPVSTSTAICASLPICWPSSFLSLPQTIPAHRSGPAGLEIPVLDKTGLQGTYDFSVDMRPELGTDGFTTWKRALEDQLGLSIESRKSDVEIVVVDDALKFPTAN